MRAYRRTKYIDKKKFRKGSSQRYVKFYSITANVRPKLANSSFSFFPYRFFFLPLFLLVLTASVIFVLSNAIHIDKLSSAGRDIADSLPQATLPTITLTLPEISLPEVAIGDILTAASAVIMASIHTAGTLLNPLPFLAWLGQQLLTLIVVLAEVTKLTFVFLWTLLVSMVEILNPRPLYVLFVQALFFLLHMIYSFASALFLGIANIVGIVFQFAANAILAVLHFLDPRPFLGSVWKGFLESVLKVLTYYRYIDPYVKVVVVTLRESLAFLGKGLTEMSTVTVMILKYGF